MVAARFILVALACLPCCALGAYFTKWVDDNFDSTDMTSCTLTNADIHDPFTSCEVENFLQTNSVTETFLLTTMTMTASPGIASLVQSIKGLGSDRYELTETVKLNNGTVVSQAGQFTHDKANKRLESDEYDGYKLYLYKLGIPKKMSEKIYYAQLAEVAADGTVTELAREKYLMVNLTPFGDTMAAHFKRLQSIVDSLCGSGAFDVKSNFFLSQLTIDPSLY